MLMVARGPSPGSRPTSVPTVQPMAQNMRFCQRQCDFKPKREVVQDVHQ